MSEMIERCRAAFALARAKLERDARVCELTDQEQLSLVVAVIEAMRDIDESMLQAALAVPLISLGNGQYRKPSFEDEWRAAIDAALSHSGAE